MTGENWDQIKNNYQIYLQKTKDSTGISIGEGSTGYPLRDAILQEMSISIRQPRNHIEHLISFNEDIPSIRRLETETYLALSVELTNLLQVAITDDHIGFWKWTYDLATYMNESKEPLVSGDIWHNISTVFEMVLCNPSVPANSMEGRVLSKTDFIAGYAAYPVLEGFLKRLSSEDIGGDGTIKQDERVYNYSDGSYYKKGDQCSNLTDILVHYEEQIANDVLRVFLEVNRQYIAKFGEVDEDHAYGLISEWRNSMLHGQNQADVQFGITLNIICLIIWFHVLADDSITGEWKA